ncbi:hypothetical protein HPB51_012373 [Rhipicephalus microplus]|uniref:Uncharacterized protein n=1 Tax=Rhipicephalus microplus TaxID=6941 RepID=A0A9J6DGH1_RHIMP|nr:hypothetical protein HPB51_012373 [Rhipicephalus microplus]
MKSVFQSGRLSHDELYPPCLAEGQVHGYLRLLEGKCGADLLAVLLRKRDGVQLVLEGLQQPAGLSLAALHHLVAMLSPARPNGLGGSECFVLRTLTRQLLRKLPDQGSAGDTEKLVAFLLRQLYATTPLYKVEKLSVYFRGVVCSSDSFGVHLLLISDYFAPLVRVVYGSHVHF